ncbi:uncharacterized protein TRAVEDRAFT_131111, partial [Trametes versicolor FP-101664 SS1]|uniref:uncharacterized protein n=1 Tax=Trametes versicolor (strain FP-101664) TaxID=717944 RepID=UPI00046221F8
AGTSGRVLCAICLGHHPSTEIYKCVKSKLWNGMPAFSARVGKRIQTRKGAPLCIAWQRPNGCASDEHPERHVCSGCGGTDHGASSCALAEKD